MKSPRTKITVSYRILDDSGHTLEVIKETGYNRNNIKWLVERRVLKKYGKLVKIRQLKIVEEID